MKYIKRLFLLLSMIIAVFTVIQSCATVKDLYKDKDSDANLVRLTKAEWNNSLKNEKYLFIKASNRSYDRTVKNHEVEWVVSSDYPNTDMAFYSNNFFKCLNKELKYHGMAALDTDTVSMYGSYEPWMNTYYGFMTVHSHPELCIKYKVTLAELQDTETGTYFYKPNICFAFLTWHKFYEDGYSRTRKKLEPHYTGLNIENANEIIENKARLECDYIKRLLSFKNVFDVSQFLDNYDIRFYLPGPNGDVNRNFVRIYNFKNGKMTTDHTIVFGYPQFMLEY